MTMSTKWKSASITKLEQYGDRGWQWESDGVAMRTNGQGNGLWYVGSYTGIWASNYEDKQTAGTSQFQLPYYDGTAKTKKAVRNKLYREFGEEVYD